MLRPLITLKRVCILFPVARVQRVQDVGYKDIAMSAGEASVARDDDGIREARSGSIKRSGGPMNVTPTFFLPSPLPDLRVTGVSPYTAPFTVTRLHQHTHTPFILYDHEVLLRCHRHRAHRDDARCRRCEACPALPRARMCECDYGRGEGDL